MPGNARCLLLPSSQLVRKTGFLGGSLHGGSSIARCRRRKRVVCMLRLTLSSRPSAAYGTSALRLAHGSAVSPSIRASVCPEVLDAL